MNLMSSMYFPLAYTYIDILFNIKEQIIYYKHIEHNKKNTKEAMRLETLRIGNLFFSSESFLHCMLFVCIKGKLSKNFSYRKTKGENVFRNFNT